MFPLERVIPVYVDNWKNLFPIHSKMRHKLEDLLVELFLLFDRTFSQNEGASPFRYPEFERFLRDILSLQYHYHSRLKAGDTPIRKEEVDSILNFLKESYNVSYSSDPVIRKFILSRMEKMVYSFNENPLHRDRNYASSISVEKKVKIDKKEFYKQYPIEMDKYVEIYVPETAKDSYNVEVYDLKSFGLTLDEYRESMVNCTYVNRVFGYFIQPHPYNCNVKDMWEYQFLRNWFEKDPLGKRNPLETFFGLLSDLFIHLLFDPWKEDRDIKSDISSFRSAISYLFYVIKEDEISHLDIQVGREKKLITVTPYVFLT